MASKRLRKHAKKFAARNSMAREVSGERKIHNWRQAVSHYLRSRGQREIPMQEPKFLGSKEEKLKTAVRGGFFSEYPWRR